MRGLFVLGFVGIHDWVFRLARVSIRLSEGQDMGERFCVSRGRQPPLVAGTHPQV
jgi:hypothetical protein